LNDRRCVTTLEVARPWPRNSRRSIWEPRSPRRFSARRLRDQDIRPRQRSRGVPRL
jgi:hypothetical protein